MHHLDYELAENCLQVLREGRSRRLTAQDVQDIANRMFAPSDAIQRSHREPVDNAREDARLAICTLSSEMEKQPADDASWAWDTAIALTEGWFKATESDPTRRG